MGFEYFITLSEKIFGTKSPLNKSIGLITHVCTFLGLLFVASGLFVGYQDIHGSSFECTGTGVLMPDDVNKAYTMSFFHFWVWEKSFARPTIVPPV